jgi:hypothetical protein
VDVMTALSILELVALKLRRGGSDARRVEEHQHEGHDHERLPLILIQHDAVRPAALARGRTESNDGPVDPSALHVDRRDDGVAARLADVIADRFSKTLLVARKLPHGKCVDVHDAHFLVWLDDAVADDAIVAVRTAGRIGATGLPVVTRATTSNEAQHEQDPYETKK